MKMIAFGGVYDVLLMAYGFKLPHDVVFSSAKRMKTADSSPLTFICGSKITINLKQSLEIFGKTAILLT